MADGQSQSWGDLQNAYGLTQSQVSSLQSAGYSTDQASQLLGLSSGIAGGGTGQPSGGLGSGGNQRGITTLPTIGGSGLTPSTLIGLAGALKGGGGGGGMPQGAVDPSRAIENLGAAALNEQAVYNPQPGGGSQGGQQQGSDFAKSGVQQIGGPTMTSTVPTVPQGPWSTTPGIFTKSTQGTAFDPQNPAGWMARNPGQAITVNGAPTTVPVAGDPNFAKFQQQLIGDVGQGAKIQLQPGAFNQPPPTAAAPVTPSQPATAAAFQPGTPFATAPPAPGVSTSMGAPAMAGQMNLPLFGLTGGSTPMGAWPTGGAGAGPGPTGAATALATAAAQPPKRFQSGGIVTQPTNAIIGEAGPEAVIPLGGYGSGSNNSNDYTEQQIALLQQQLRNQDPALNLQASIGRVNPQSSIARPTPMAGQNQGSAQAQARAAAEGQANAAQIGPTGAQGQQAAQYGQTRPMTPRIWQGQAPAAPTPQPTQGDRTRASMQNPRGPMTSAQDYANRANAGQGQPQQMTSAQDYADYANWQNAGKLSQPNPKGFTTDPSTGTIYDPNREVYESPGTGFTTKGGALYDPQGNVYESNPAATAGSGGAGGGIGQMGSSIAGGIGAIGQAFANAFNQIAGQSWKMQPSHIPAPPPAPNTNYNLQTPNA